MIEYTYGIVKDTFSIENEERTSYGIAVYADVNQCGTATIVEIISDISEDKNSISMLVKNMNDYNLSPIHMKDVVEDFLAIGTVKI